MEMGGMYYSTSLPGLEMLARAGRFLVVAAPIAPLSELTFLTPVEV